MSIHHEWVVKGRVLLTVFEGALTARELRQLDQHYLSLLEQLHEPLHFILDVRRIERFPPSWGDLAETLYFPSHPYTEQIIGVVEPGAVFASISKGFLERVLKTTAQSQPSIAEAAAFLGWENDASV